MSGQFDPGFGIVYFVRNETGELVAKGNAEFLNAVYSDVAGIALKGYCERKSFAKIKGFFVRRRRAHYGCIGPFRTCVFGSSDLRNSTSSPTPLQPSSTPWPQLCEWGKKGSPETGNCAGGR